MKKQDPKGRRAFLLSLGISLFLLLTAAGLVAVDWQGRSLSFGDDDPPFRVVDGPGDKTELEVKLLGAEGRVDITKLNDFFDFLCDFGCIPHK